MSADMKSLCVVKEVWDIKSRNQTRITDAGLEVLMSAYRE
jgi:hypothetical protein